MAAAVDAWQKGRGGAVPPLLRLHKDGNGVGT